MGIQVQGYSGVIADVGGTTFRALSVAQKPIEYGAFGSYRKSMISGTIAAALGSNSEIYQFRWTDATRLAVVQQLILDGLAGSATAFTAGFGKIDVLVARSFSAAGTGGNTATLTGNNGKMRTSMGTTLMGEVRCASTAALGVGTKTNDTDPIAQMTFTVGTAVSVQYLGQTVLLGQAVGPEHPLVLAQNEGFVMRATVPATGTWQFGVTTAHSEVAAY